jgi:hypothetical protein
LTEYKIVSETPGEVVLPWWLEALAVSRALILLVEIYFVTQPFLNLPKIPEVGKKLYERLLT